MISCSLTWLGGEGGRQGKRGVMLVKAQALSSLLGEEKQGPGSSFAKKEKTLSSGTLCSALPGRKGPSIPVLQEEANETKTRCPEDLQS